MVRLAQAASDEVYGIKGEIPGDQRQGAVMPDGTQEGELNIVPWYDMDWNVVFRPISPEVAETMAREAEKICKNVNVGYSWYRLMSFFNAFKAAGWDGSKINEKCDTHCAGLIAALCNAAGLKVNPQMYTGNEWRALMNTGAFLALTDDAYTKTDKNLKRGDVPLHRANGEGHTCIVLDDARDLPTEPYLVTGNNLRLRPGPGTEYTPVLAYMTMGDTFNVFSFAEDSEGASWAQGEYKGLTGYASMQYLVKEQDPDGDGEDDVVYVVTAAKSARIREYPGAYNSNPTLAWPKNGEELIGLGQEEDIEGTPWYYVAYYDVVGWISGKMVKQV